MDIYSIYRATNTINAKSYIGFTSQTLSQRKYRHHQDAKINRGYALAGAIRKYGKRAFIWEVIYQSKDKQYCLSEMEGYFIRLFNTHCDYGWGYNLTYGGEGLVGMSESTRQKRSTLMLGNIPWNKGKINPFTRTARNKMSQSMKGRIPWNKGIKGKSKKDAIYPNSNI